MCAQKKLYDRTRQKIFSLKFKISTFHDFIQLFNCHNALYRGCLADSGPVVREIFMQVFFYVKKIVFLNKVTSFRVALAVDMEFNLCSVFYVLWASDEASIQAGGRLCKCHVRCNGHYFTQTERLGQLICVISRIPPTRGPPVDLLKVRPESGCGQSVYAGTNQLISIMADNWQYPQRAFALRVAAASAYMEI